MSVRHDDRMGFGFIFDRKRDPDLVRQWITHFDHAVEHDIEDINREKRVNKTWRKLAVIRTLVFPMEAFLILFILGIKSFVKRVELQQATWKFLRGKISRQELMNAIVSSAQ